MIRIATLSLFLGAAVPAQAQLLAQVDTVQGANVFGTFFIELDYSYAPYQCANFVRLAEGLIPTFDSEGRAQPGKPFYDGLAFYNTKPNSEIITGSGDDSGNETTGYVFRDDTRSEFQYGRTWGVFMENDGPNTNGGRFFININTATGNFDPGRAVRTYSRFGVVTNAFSGQVVARAISNWTATTTHPIRIDKVTMIYNDPFAVAFQQKVLNPNDPILSLHPTSAPATVSFRGVSEQTFLDWDTTAGSIAKLWFTNNGSFWWQPFLQSELANVPNSGAVRKEHHHPRQCLPCRILPRRHLQLSGVALSRADSPQSHHADAVHRSKPGLDQHAVDFRWHRHRWRFHLG